MRRWSLHIDFISNKRGSLTKQNASRWQSAGVQCSYEGKEQRSQLRLSQILAHACLALQVRVKAKRAQ